MYAKCPPDDFDWIKYFDKLRLRTCEYKKKQRSTTGTKKKSGDEVDDDRQPSEKKAMGDDNAPSGSSTETPGEVEVCTSDLSDDHHRVGGRLIKVTRADLKQISGVITSPTEPISPQPGGAKSHFNRAATDSLSQSARAPRGGGGKSHFNRATSDSISQSARAPRSRFGRKR